MIEKNTVIIDLKDYNELKEQLCYYKIKELVIKGLESENKELKVKILKDWLKRKFAKVTNNGNNFDWEYNHTNNEYHAFAFKLKASLEVAEIALNDYIESQKGEEE